MDLNIGVTPHTPGNVPASVDVDVTTTTYEVDILRTHEEVHDVLHGYSVTEVMRPNKDIIESSFDAPVAEIVRPGGTVTNIGAGPVLPAHPYEGQVWILT